MANKNTATAVFEAIAPVTQELGYMLWDVRYEKEGANWFLRVFIDGASPIGLEDCEKVSRAIDPILDELDPIQEQYYLEVSSAGLGRRLVKPEHFERCQGERVLARLIRPLEDGTREIVGTLDGLVDGAVRIVTEDGVKTVVIKDTSLVKLCDDEDLFEKN